MKRGMIAAIAAGVVAYFLLRKRRTSAAAEVGEQAGKAAQPPQSTAAFGWVVESFPLAYGMYGQKVQKLQKYLISHGYNLAADSYFGDATKRAVISSFGAPSVDGWQYTARLIDSY
jgi:peptidoglycan hydrolase-like protein with peptidoglycan-binding domain